MPADVLRVNGTDRVALGVLLARYGLALRFVAPDEPVRGSWWGGAEAGLVADALFARLDTPVHSVLHEAAHYICMTPERRAGLDRDAGGDDAEECGVCYLQLLLAQALPGVGRERLCDDMDAWGYSFREGSTRAWLAGDAADARLWLLAQGIIDEHDAPTGELRQC
ncbi:MAG: hypothetical protein AMXMBFR37_24920 [Steroidobacteraceae bacterium]